MLSRRFGIIIIPSKYFNYKYNAVKSNKHLRSIAVGYRIDRNKKQMIREIENLKCKGSA